MLQALIAAVFVGLATHRITRLVVDDSITRPIRKVVLAKAPEKLSELIVCPWCLSGWVAAGLIAATAQFEPIPVPVVAWLAAWSVGVLAYHATEALALAASDE